MNISRIKNSAILFATLGAVIGYAILRLITWDSIFDEPLRYLWYVATGGGVGLFLGLIVGVSKWAEKIVKSDEEIDQEKTLYRLPNRNWR